MTEIEIYTKNTCPYCFRAKALLDSLGLDYSEYEISDDLSKRAEMIKRSNRFTVPQIFINNQPIGGSDELIELVDSGVFATLLNYPHNKTIQPEELKNAA